MARCAELAEQARAAGCTPVGSVIVLDSEVIAEAAEEVPRGPRAFAHAELLAVEQALRTTTRDALARATLYSTAEPCLLCGFAIREARIGRVVIARPTGEIGSVSSRFPILTTADVTRWGPPPAIVWWPPR